MHIKDSPDGSGGCCDLYCGACLVLDGLLSAAPLSDVLAWRHGGPAIRQNQGCQAFNAGRAGAACGLRWCYRALARVASRWGSRGVEVHRHERGLPGGGCRRDRRRVHAPCALCGPHGLFGKGVVQPLPHPRHGHRCARCPAAQARDCRPAHDCRGLAARKHARLRCVLAHNRGSQHEPVALAGIVRA